MLQHIKTVSATTEPTFIELQSEKETPQHTPHVTEIETEGSLFPMPHYHNLFCVLLHFFNSYTINTIKGINYSETIFCKEPKFT